MDEDISKLRICWNWSRYLIIVREFIWLIRHLRGWCVALTWCLCPKCSCSHLIPYSKIALIFTNSLTSLAWCLTSASHLLQLQLKLVVLGKNICLCVVTITRKLHVSRCLSIRWGSIAGLLLLLNYSVYAVVPPVLCSIHIFSTCRI